MPTGVTFTSITQGASHRCALTSLGVAYCWGNNPDGQLGAGVSGMPVVLPQQVTMPSGVTFTSIDTDENHTCAISTSNTAYCWGDNDEGQLGDGTSMIDRSVPVPVSMPSGITFTKIATGDNHTCALSSTGTAYCWGDNLNWQLGDGTTTDSLTPVAVPMPSGGVVFRDISAGRYRTCALSTTNVAYCWGPRYTGLSGSSTTGVEAVTMPSGTTFTTITSGNDVECALTPAGTAFCWGDPSRDGTVGDGTSTPRPNPVAVVMPAGVTFTTIHSAGETVCATSSHGKVYCWGQNNMNQFGNGTSTDSNIPVMATHP